MINLTSKNIAFLNPLKLKADYSRDDVLEAARKYAIDVETFGRQIGLSPNEVLEMAGIPKLNPWFVRKIIETEIAAPYYILLDSDSDNNPGIQDVD